MIQRDLYINRIKPYINQNLIKVLTGQRRVGKSFVLQLLAEEIRKEFPSSNIIFIDKEKYSFDFMRSHAELMEFINAHKTDGTNYLFIDEVQEIDGFERVLRSLNSDPNFDIYCTGSNAQVFSSELATYLSGRQIVFHIGSLNFNEFCAFHKMQANQESLSNYILYGGLPYMVHLPDDIDIRFEYLNNMYSTILFRDVVRRHQIRDTRFLNDLIKFLADNTGSIFSANKISAYLKNQKINKNVALILDYISYIEGAYFINKVQRLDIVGKRHFEVGEKYYFEDIGLRNAIVGFNVNDMGKIIENLVYLHLRNMQFNIRIGEMDGHEIDFVAERKGETVYIQVAYKLNDSNTIEREFGNLLKIADNYPKFVISYESFSPPNTYKGIQHQTLLQFLSSSI